MLLIFKRCIAEFIGAFAIVLGGCGAIIVDQFSNGGVTHLGVAVTFGLIVMTFVYAAGHISGAHFNPAVTIAFSLVRHFPKREIAPYIIAQCAGAAFASWIHVVTLKPIFENKFPGVILNLGVTQPVDGLYQTAFIWEALVTFFLMFVIMAVATDYRAVKDAAAIAIGGVVMLNALFAGLISGASMNPARSFGPALLSGNWEHFTAYVLGPIVGACLAAVIYDGIRCEEKQQVDVKGCC